MPQPAFPIPMPSNDYIARFEDGYMPVTESGCWIWMGATNYQGHGWVRINGRSCGAHRVSWRIYRGEIPRDLYVLHKCNVHSCVNPDHLYLGTHADNANDRRVKYWRDRGFRSLPPRRADFAKLYA